MSGAIDESALQAGLRDIRLPGEAVGGWLAEMSATVALACILVLVVGGVLWLLSERRAKPRLRTLQDELASLEQLPEDRQCTALLHLLKRHAPEKFAALGQSLYQPNSGLRAADLRAELLRHA